VLDLHAEEGIVGIYQGLSQVLLQDTVYALSAANGIRCSCASATVFGYKGVNPVLHRYGGASLLRACKTSISTPAEEHAASPNPSCMPDRWRQVSCMYGTASADADFTWACCHVGICKLVWRIACVHGQVCVWLVHAALVTVMA
jgi:hypothetical protein